MLLLIEKAAMNYEALGRYTEAVEQAKKAAAKMHNAFADVGRLTRSTHVGADAIGTEHDFEKIHAAVKEAEQAHTEMLVAVSTANHEAEACERRKITLHKA
jgi:hypothetical protein